MREKIRFKQPPEWMLIDKPVFIDKTGFFSKKDEVHEGLLNWLKAKIKKNKFIYRFLFYVVGPSFFLGKSPMEIFKILPANALVAEIGSGDRRLGKEVVNVDIYPWPEVDVVADAHDLPFADNSLDGLVSTWNIEHLIEPTKAVAEMLRVLRPDGVVFLSTNFVYPYHSSPADYYRWTKEGLLHLLSGFETLEIKMTIGPTSALLAVFQEWLAVLLSFGNRRLKDIWWLLIILITFPLKIFDLLLIHYPSGEAIAGGFYFLGQ